MAARSTSSPIRALVLPLLLALGPPGCYAPETEAIHTTTTELSVATSTFPAHAARQWMTNLARSVRFDGITPPVAARTYTYAAIAIYESVVHGMPGYRSLAGQLNGLDALPLPTPGLEYDWPTVLAQTMSRVVNEGVFAYNPAFFYEIPPPIPGACCVTTPTHASLLSLGPVQIGYRRAAGVPEGVIGNSIAFGNALADALVAWTNADGYYAIRYKGWIPPKGVDKWVPTGFQDADKVANPLEPFFGTLRPAVLAAPNECAPPPPVPFSTDPSSAFFAQAHAVYDTDTHLTDAQIEIANFWADGPGATPTPAGHWLNIATKFLRPRNLADAAAGYAFTSLGYLDSFIAIWEGKYTYNLLRPETYIRRHIDPGWRPLLPTPQFPSYMSGHSGQSNAAAVVFTEWFGDGAFIDDTKVRTGFTPRSFPNFTAAAAEAADSRIYGGIHYPMDDLPTQGVCVGEKIIERVSLTL